MKNCVSDGTRGGPADWLSSPSDSTPGRWRAEPPLLAALFVLGWVLVALLTNSAQYGDHFEQFAWAQSLEWGYHKHPPLPSWLLAVAIRIGGLQPWWPSVLAAVCVALNLLLTWRIACRLIGEDRAALAVLFAGLQQGFMAKAQLFNHNSVLVVCVSATVLLTLRATQVRADRPVPNPTLRWALVGVMAGLAMLSKYQAASPLLGVLVALGGSGALHHPANRRGLALAVALAVLMLVPHVAWVATHGWSTVAYATQAGTTLSFAERLTSVGKFFAIQVRMVLPALLMLLIMARWPGRSLRSLDPAPVPAPAPSTAPATAPIPFLSPHRHQQVWLFGLLGVPVVGVLTAALLGSLRLQDHWGIQTFQFLGLVVAAAWPRAVLTAWRRWTVIALALHGLWALAYTAPRWTDLASSPRQRVDEFYPAQALAGAVGRAWAAAIPSGCPLRYVRGPGFEAGMVGLYAADRPSVVDVQLSRTPWLRTDDLIAAGHVAVRLGEAPEQDEVSGGPVLRGEFSFEVPAQRRAPKQTLHWMIVPPTGCSGR